MIFVRSVEKEEGLLALSLSLNPGASLSSKDIAHSRIVPYRRPTSAHPTDAADTVNQPLIVTVRPIHT
jgi:hypothetical protein